MKGKAIGRPAGRTGVPTGMVLRGHQMHCARSAAARKKKNPFTFGPVHCWLRNGFRILLSLFSNWSTGRFLRALESSQGIDDNVLHLMSGIPSANCVFEPGEQCANVREPFQAVEILESGFVCFVL